MGARDVARPKVPLISKRKALEAALDIIDTEGIDALSIRRLAERLKVNGASLYHHFENKDEIVVGAAKLALEDVRTPLTYDEPWRIWIMRNNRTLRQAFRDHPHIVPVMLRRDPLQIGASQLDATAARLEAEGVPVGAIAPMLEALELYAVSSALHEGRSQEHDIRGTADEDAEETAEDVRTPHLRKAFAQRALTPDEVFDKVCGQIIDTVVATAAERAAAAPTPKPAARQRRAKASA
jgi:AcrR family transcriptional regulator